MSDYSFSIRLYAQEYYHLSTENNCEGTLFTLLFINFYFGSNRFNISDCPRNSVTALCFYSFCFVHNSESKSRRELSDVLN